MKKKYFNDLFYETSFPKVQNLKEYVTPKYSILFGFVLVLMAFMLPGKAISADIETPIPGEISVLVGPSNVSLAPAAIINHENGNGVVGFAKSFSPSTIDPGSVTTLTFTIDNTESGEAISNITFIDNLPAGMTIATPANVVSLCGGDLVAPDGGSSISLTGASLGFGEMCTISVDVKSIIAGTHTNTTGDLTYVGANTGPSPTNAGPASADLTVNTGLAGFSKAFFHDVQGLGGVTTLTFTIDNSLSGEDISSVNFTDNLPSGMTIATPANLVSSCGGIISAPNGGSTISYSGYGGVALGLGQVCTISVDVTGSNVGVNTNTTEDLNYIGAISGSANAGNATAVLTVSEAFPGFSKSFSPNSIGPGSTTTLTFTIDNTSSGETISDISFIDNLPAGMTIATPANATNSCGLGGTLIAPDGGNSISFSGGSLGLNEICTISVNVTSSALGAHTNESGFLNYVGTNSGSAVAGRATANLTVSASKPGFSKSFSPNTVNTGERSRLTFTVDNLLNANAIGNLDFTDHLPAGMVVASPANISFDCVSANPGFVSTVTAVPGSSTIVFDGNGFNFPGFEVLAAGATCTVSVDVIATGFVDLNNVTQDLLADFVSSGKASNVLHINPRAELFIDKTFVTNPATPGTTTDLVYTIKNFSRSSSATGISFTDDLTFLTDLVATGAATSDCGVSMTGTSVLNFTGGTLDPGATCTITVPLQVPIGAVAGTYSSTTSVITGVIDGSPVTGNMTTETLFIQSLPTITKTFLNNPVASGGTTTLEFTITNTDPDNALTDIGFTDNMTDFLGIGFPTQFVDNLPENGDCGVSSTFSITQSDFNPTTFVMTGGEIAAGGSCTFTIDVNIPDGFSGGIYTNTTSNLTGTLDGVSVIGFPATDDLVIASVPQLQMTFTDDPVEAGDTVDLEFELSYSALADASATDVGFTLDLASVISGLTATGPVSSCGGTLVSSVGDTFLTYSGGTMEPGDVCTFNIPVLVPAGTVPGAFPANTSALTATIGSLAATGFGAADDLIVGGLTLTKEFINNPVIPGQLTTLRFTIENSTTLDATNVQFFDNLNVVLSGLAAEAPLPTPSCGGSLTGTTFLVYSEGTVSAGTTCTFDVEVRVPAGAASGTYRNITSNLTATLNDSNLTLQPAIDDLVVENNLILLTKSFIDDPVLPGADVTVEYTLENLDLVNTINDIAFTDNFADALVGLEATGLPANFCSGTVSGTGLLSFSGGSLAAGASCTFSVTLSTPGDTPNGTVVTSTTSDLTGDVGGFSVIGDAASDDLSFQSLSLTKSMTGPVDPGASVVITFTITNDDPDNSIDQISFTDDLDAFISGMVATELPASTTCGESSGVTGTSLLTFARGSLEPNSSCSFDVTVLVPCDTAENTYSNTTSVITGEVIIDGVPTTLVAAAAVADLTVNPAPAIELIVPATVCSNAGVQVGLGGGTPVGGVYSGDGVSDDGDGLTYSFDPSVAGVGPNIITYTVTNNNDCSNSAMETINVIFCGGPEPFFITKWVVNAGETITIPTKGFGYDYSVDWSYNAVDGFNADESNVTGDVTSPALTAGEHIVAITGDFPRIFFNNSGDKDKITEIVQWGTNPWTSMDRAFAGCSNLNITNAAVGAPDLSLVTNMTRMFNRATSFNGDIGNWDVSNVSNMSYLFALAKAFNQDLSNWDTSNVTNMREMFNQAWAFNSSVDWDVSNVEDMAGMFFHALTFNQDISNWDTSSVTNMFRMLNDAESFDQNLGAWDIGNVTNMEIMLFDSQLSISNYDATLIGWAEDSSGTPGDGIDDIPRGIVFHGGDSRYCLGETARNLLTAPSLVPVGYGWSITDDGLDCVIPETVFITKWVVNAGEAITIPTKGFGYNYSVDWSYDASDRFYADVSNATGNVTSPALNAGEHIVAITGDFPRIFFDNRGDKDKITEIVQWGPNPWTTMDRAFAGCSNLNIGLNAGLPNLSLVTNMTRMFNKATAFNSDIGDWDVSNVTNMSYLFALAKTFNQDLGSWDTSNVTNMREVFNQAWAFNSSVDWDVSNVEDMAGMFFHALAFNQDISNWDTSSVKDMFRMLNDAESFDQNLGAWDIGNVTNMQIMLFDSELSTANYDATLIGWATDSSGTPGDGIDDIPTSIIFDGGNSKYCAGETSRNLLIAGLPAPGGYGWTITDGGLDCPNPPLLGSNNFNVDFVSLYPNPTESSVTIVSPQMEITSATVYDIRGRKVAEVDFRNQTNYQIDLSDMEGAVYFIEVVTDNGTVMKRVVKK